MSRLIQPLLFLFARCNKNDLIRQIEFLKAENEMLRKRVPKKRIILKPAERDRLIELGKGLGHKLTIYGQSELEARIILESVTPSQSGWRLELSFRDFSVYLDFFVFSGKNRQNLGTDFSALRDLWGEGLCNNWMIWTQANYWESLSGEIQRRFSCYWSGMNPD